MIKKIILLIIIIFGTIFLFASPFSLFQKGQTYFNKVFQKNSKLFSKQENDQKPDEIANTVLPKEGVNLPITWDDLGKKMVEEGVIDQTKFKDLYRDKNYYEALSFIDKDTKTMTMNENNANLLLNLFWAFGLSNKNRILEEGTMTDPKYGGAGGFASTGGWTISNGEAMDHYSKHEFIKMSPSQQAIAEKASKNIYRPCCDNSTFFPDCDHGMAMLGLLELMAARSVSEDQMYKIALKVNSFWFPSQYLTIAQYFNENNKSWSKVDPKLVLGPEFSSSSGFQAILAKVKNPPEGGGSKCKV